MFALIKKWKDEGVDSLPAMIHNMQMNRDCELYRNSKHCYNYPCWPDIHDTHCLAKAYPALSYATFLIVAHSGDALIV